MLREKLHELVQKYNACVLWYFEQFKLIKKNEVQLLNENEKYGKLLDYLQETLQTTEGSMIVFEYVKTKLENFSRTFDINVLINIDDFKLLYFIALYFIQQDEKTKNKEELRILFIALHNELKKLLITEEPKIMLEKFDRFFREQDYKKFTEEYGDVGYYHSMKSIYLMQVITIKELIETEKIVIDDTFVSKYFLNNKSCIS